MTHKNMKVIFMCGVAQHGAAWLSMVQRGSVMVRRGSVGSASACCKAGPSSILGSAPQGGSPTEQTSDEEMEIGLSEWRRINVLYECDCMNVCMYVIKYEK
jgi:hypothetical protein